MAAPSYPERLLERVRIGFVATPHLLHDFLEWQVPALIVTVVIVSGVFLFIRLFLLFIFHQTPEDKERQEKREEAERALKRELDQQLSKQTGLCSAGARERVRLEIQVLQKMLNERIDMLVKAG